MPTPKKGARLGGSPAHQKLIVANLATSLFEHGRVTTTEAKARVLRPVAERLITKAKKGDLHNRRQVLATIKDKGVVHALFEEIAPRFAERPGGYTRLLRIGYRRGDSAEVAQVELVGSEFNPRAKAEADAAKAEAPKQKGVGGRLRAAAERLRGKKAAAAEDEAPAHETTKPAKRAAKTGTRKTGGSNRGK